MPDHIEVEGPYSSHEVAMEAMLSDSSMEDVIGFAEGTLESMDVPMKQAHRSMIVLDEICSNIFKYSGAKVFRVSIRKSEDDVILTFMDDGEEFDPLLAEDVDISEPVDQRDVGGLGILLSKSLSKSIDYEYVDGNNVITVTLGSV